MLSAPAKTIESCQGEDGCYGRVAGKVKPIVFKSISGQVRVMVITEQPRSARSDKGDLKDALTSGAKNSIPRRLVELLGNEFAESVINERGVFNWTHFVKCPGNFRKLKPRPLVRRCAETHLLKEIRVLKPSLLICVGGESSSWLLELAGLEVDWRDCVMDQLCKKSVANLRLKLHEDTKDEFLEVKALFLFHPAERSGIGWHYDSKLKDLLKTTIASIAK